MALMLTIILQVLTSSTPESPSRLPMMLRATFKRILPQISSPEFPHLFLLVGPEDHHKTRLLDQCLVPEEDHKIGLCLETIPSPHTMRFFERL